MNERNERPEPPFAKVLIANRGEIAVRIARACRELGCTAVAVYGPGEENAAHVRAADEAYRLQSAAPLPYLDAEAVIAAARQAGAGAVHPGYGFLSENAAFAEACAAAGLVFIGPPPEAIRAMGEKIASREIAQAAGVPVVPGSDGPVASPEDAGVVAERIGYPVAIKASGGGGGRGFRVARTAADLPEAFAGASGEATRSFANPDVYLERYLDRPRHVEMQVIGGPDGEMVVLGERDCSIQRRHQKLVEETPAPLFPAATRARMAEAAAALGRAVGYRNAGTVEFILAEDGSFYFLEMNTRIQVEHPVTELVTGIDLVKEQIRVAAGWPLSFTQEEVQPRGHAIECRINAEDPGRNFAPAPGALSTYREPGGFGVRVETAMEPGAAILPNFDSMIAKLAVWGRDRDEAIDRMTRALADFAIGGVATTIPFHRNVMAHPAFRAGQVSTSFIPEHPEVIPPPFDGPAAAAPDGTESQEAREVIAEVTGRRFVVRITGELGGGLRRAARPAGAPRRVAASRKPVADGPEVASPIQGTVVRIVAEAGAAVSRGDVLLIVEAMKMENEIAAHRDGTLEAVLAEIGAAVKIGDVVARIG